MRQRSSSHRSFAAALAGGGSHMGRVVSWLDRQESQEPDAILAAKKGHAEARDLLSGIGKLDDRNRGTTYMSAKALVAAYRYPEARATDGPGFDPVAFCRSKATLYVVASAEVQELLAPVIVALVSRILDAAADHRRVEGEPLSPSLRLVLDEAANVAPIRSLPRYLSLCAGDGVRVASIWQTYAQLERLGRGAADEVLGNSQAKVLMGPITDDATRRAIVGLLGQEISSVRSRTSRGLGGVDSVTESERERSKAPAQALQQLGPDRALVVHGSHLPFVVRTCGYWKDPTLRSVATGERDAASAVRELVRQGIPESERARGRFGL